MVKHSEEYKTLSEVKRWYFIKDVVKLILTARHKMQNHYNDIHKDFIIKRNLAIGSILYIAAGRVSEVRDLTIKDIKLYKNTLNNKFMSISMKNRKNRKQRFKTNIANLKNESFFINVIIDYFIVILKYYNPELDYKLLLSDKYDIEDERYLEVLDKPIFITPRSNKKLCSYSIRLICNNFYGMNSHTFRKIRLTHLVVHYKMSAKEVQNFAGHSSIVSAEPYINITNRDFESKMSFSAR